MQARVLAWGHHLPPFVERVGTRRPIAEEPVGPSTLAARAAALAFERSGRTAQDVDFIVFATTTPDVTFPGSACYLQDQLGCGTVPCLDIRAQCAGFIFALDVAEKFLRTGQAQCALVAGGEVYSSGVDYEWQPEVARLFGDGAGVAVLGPAADGSGIEAIVTHSDGRHHRAFWCEYPASRQHPLRITREDFGLGKHLPRLNVDTVAEFGREHLPAVVKEALDRAGCSLSAVDHFVMAHVFPEVAEEAGRRLGLLEGNLTNPAADMGHLGAASLPLAVSRALQEGRLSSGARVCLAACGAGFAWGAALLRV
ncbi:MAG: ketoacyl-ACP synthase III [Candidatus Binatia bacterium]|nr:ketoacyl-ACP synthase III [Candidatus Binatia bacterium]